MNIVFCCALPVALYDFDANMNKILNFFFAVIAEITPLKSDFTLQNS